MVKGYPPAVWIGATVSQRRAAGPRIRLLAGATLISHTRLELPNRAKIRASRSRGARETVLKYLVITALVSLLLLLLYSRVHPYIQLLKKILGTVKTVADSQSTGSSTGRNPRAKVDGKLVRCVSCGTWIPADRAIGPRTNLASYCSRECLEKSSASETRKAAS